jgi:DNA processing protein
MNINTLTLESADYPLPLSHIPKPPTIYHLGADLNKLLDKPAVAIVGSRRPTYYGKQITIELAQALAEQGITIVSGLALGIDGIAHRAALEVDGLCVAVLPGPLDNILPASHRRLANEILDKGGALISEYAPGEQPFKQNFIARNRLVSGLVKAVLITEAGEKSGTNHTVRFAREQNRDVLAVPGNVTLASHIGCNNFIKTGAALVTSYKDVLGALGYVVHQTAARAIKGRNANEQSLLDLMLKGINNGDDLLEQSKLNISDFNQALTMLEIAGKIRPLGMNHWAIF